MDIPAQLRQARAQHAQLLVDVVRILRPGVHVSEAEEDRYDPRKIVLDVVASNVPALVQGQHTRPDTPTQEIEDVRVEAFTVKVPVGTGVQLGDQVEIILCTECPSLVGSYLRVIQAPTSGVPVVRRLVAVRSLPAGTRT